MLYGNHIRSLIRRGIALSCVRRTIYGRHAKGRYTDTQRDLASCTETIYTLFDVGMQWNASQQIQSQFSNTRCKLRFGTVFEELTSFPKPSQFEGVVQAPIHALLVQVIVSLPKLLSKGG